MRAQTHAGAVFAARKVREGIKGAHWWREDLDAVASIVSDRKKRKDNLDLLEKLGGVR